MIFLVLLIVSVGFNIYQFKRKKEAPKQLAVDARQLLHDLTHGGAVIKISVLDPDGLMYYPTRGAK